MVLCLHVKSVSIKSRRQLSWSNIWCGMCLILRNLISDINCDVTAGVCTHAQCQRRSMLFNVLILHSSHPRVKYCFLRAKRFSGCSEIRATLCVASMNNAACYVILTEDGIPGAKLSKPHNKHTVSALHRWLLCRSRSPTPWKKQPLL